MEDNKWHEFPKAFFNQMDFDKFDEFDVLSGFVECFLNGAMDPILIHNDKLRKYMIDFLIECDKCASEAEKDLKKVMEGAAAQNRAKRRAAKKRGLILPNDGQKLILPDEKKKKLIVVP